MRVYLYDPDRKAHPGWLSPLPLRLPHCMDCGDCLGEKTSLKVKRCAICRRDKAAARKAEWRRRNAKNAATPKGHGASSNQVSGRELGTPAAGLTYKVRTPRPEWRTATTPRRIGSGIRSEPDS